MSGLLIDFLARRDPRERWLLALLFGLVLPLALIFGVLVPLNEAKSAALAERRDAAAVNSWVQSQVTELQQLRLQPAVPVQSTLGISGIEQSLVDAGLRDGVGSLSRDGEGLIALRFEQVEFTKLMTWMSRMAPVWGYDLMRFRFEAGPVPGLVEARLTLAPLAER